MNSSMPGFPVLHYLPEFVQTPLSRWWHLNISFSATHPLLLPSIFPSIWVFSNESAFPIRWPKYWSFSSSVSLSKEYSGFISFRIGWFYLLVFQGTLKSSLAPQFKSISSSAFSLLCGPTLTSVHDYWKNHSLDYMNLFQQSDVYAF